MSSEKSYLNAAIFNPWHIRDETVVVCETSMHGLVNVAIASNPLVAERIVFNQTAAILQGKDAPTPISQENTPQTSPAFTDVARIDALNRHVQALQEQIDALPTMGDYTRLVDEVATLQQERDLGETLVLDTPEVPTNDYDPNYNSDTRGFCECTKHGKGPFSFYSDRRGGFICLACDTLRTPSND